MSSVYANQYKTFNRISVMSLQQWHQRRLKVYVALSFIESVCEKNRRDMKFNMCFISDLFLRYLPNAIVEWLTLLLRFLEVPDSNLGPGDRLS
jgi:hypothetical protein